MLESLKVGVFLLVELLYDCLFVFLISPAVVIWMLRMINHVSLGKWQNNKHNQSVGNTERSGKRKSASNQVCIFKVAAGKKKRCLLKNLPDPSFVNLMQDKITSDDSIIRHHYQHRNVWPGAGGCAASVTG